MNSYSRDKILFYCFLIFEQHIVYWSNGRIKEQFQLSCGESIRLRVDALVGRYSNPFLIFLYFFLNLLDFPPKCFRFLPEVFWYFLRLRLGALVGRYSDPFLSWFPFHLHLTSISQSTYRHPQHEIRCQVKTFAKHQIRTFSGQSNILEQDEEFHEIL